MLTWGLRLHYALRGQGAQLPGLVLPRLARLILSELGLRLCGQSTLKLFTHVFMRWVRSQNYEQL
ncbi:hypothetical protein GCM10011375_32500 [Hymenobacter qilianensis]|uniref:Uncharacterized protein n=1 Tax=Hymenobacter qilianensis TaxID=1385715 RepID=A0ACB5PV91_9BACT|nr:hypothetical protein GCM10011375_32500 [Hymenobacter qilianensis]